MKRSRGCACARTTAPGWPARATIGWCTARCMADYRLTARGCTNAGVPGPGGGPSVHWPVPVRADESRAAVSPSEICRADVVRADRTGIGGSAVFYAYTPDWIFAAYDLRRLDEPAFDGYAQDNKEGDPLRKADCCWKFVSPTVDIDWLNKSHITCTYPDAEVYVLASSALQNAYSEDSCLPGQCGDRSEGAKRPYFED